MILFLSFLFLDFMTKIWNKYVKNVKLTILVFFFYLKFVIIIKRNFMIKVTNLLKFELFMAKIPFWEKNFF